MKPATSSCSSCALWLVLAFSGCGVDDRPLTFEYHSLQAAGASGGGVGGGAAGARSLGDAGTGGGDSAVAGSRGDAGSAEEPDGGSHENGSSNGGAGSGGTASAGAANGGLAGSQAQVAGGAGLSSAGTGGFVFSGPCGDLNHDLVDDCSQTLVQNSRFDSTASGWDAEPLLTEGWDATNASGKPGSGSLSLSHTGAGGTMIGARQCIPAVAYASYDVAARVRLAAGQTGKGGVNVYLYDDDACQGNLVTGVTPIEGGAAGTWVELLGSLWIPGSVHSMYVRLVVDKPRDQQALNVLIDDVLVAKR
jgi:hypothetical protein